MQWPRWGLRICVSHGSPDDGVAGWYGVGEESMQRRSNQFSQMEAGTCTGRPQRGSVSFPRCVVSAPTRRVRAETAFLAFAFASTFRKYALWRGECPPSGGRGKWGACPLSPGLDWLMLLSALASFRGRYVSEKSAGFAAPEVGLVLSCPQKRFYGSSSRDPTSARERLRWSFRPRFSASVPLLAYCEVSVGARAT